MQCACAILEFVVCPDLQCLSKLSHKGHDFLKKKLLNVQCVFSFFSTILSERFLILRRIERDVIQQVCWSSCKVGVIFVRFQLNLNFLYIHVKNTQMSNYTKIRQLGAELFDVDRRTDMTKLIAAFRNFAYAPTNQSVNTVYGNKRFEIHTELTDLSRT